MRQKGFTLIELIIVTVLISIVSIASFSYLGFGALIFRDTVERDDMAANSRFAIERLSRELRHALPGSPRVSEDNNCIEFVPLISSGIYFSLPDSTNTSFELSAPALAQERLDNFTPPYFLFVAANNSRRVYASEANQRTMINLNVYPIPEASGEVWRIESSSAPYTRRSPGRRYYLTSAPVSWCIAEEGYQSAQLRRYAYYNTDFTSDNTGSSRPVNFAAGVAELNSRSSSPGFSNDLMASNLDAANSRFERLTPTLNRNNLVLLDLTFLNSTGTESMTLYHEVHIPNVP